MSTRDPDKYMFGLSAEDGPPEAVPRGYLFAAYLSQMTHQVDDWSTSHNKERQCAVLLRFTARRVPSLQESFV